MEKIRSIPKKRSFFDKNIELSNIEIIKIKPKIKFYNNDILINKLENRTSSCSFEFDLHDIFIGKYVDNINIFHNNPEINQCIDNYSFYTLTIGGRIVNHKICNSFNPILSFYLLVALMKYHEIRLCIYVNNENMIKYVDDNFELNIQYKNCIFNGHVNEIFKKSTPIYIPIECNILAMSQGIGGNIISDNILWSYSDPHFFDDLKNVKFDNTFIDNWTEYLLDDDFSKIIKKLFTIEELKQYVKFLCIFWLYGTTDKYPKILVNFFNIIH
jgi:hypothetical protein